jgi:L-seryl-tRNA(Ser) seleniumtransferase
MENELRRLPSVDKVISDERLEKLGVGYPRGLIVDMARRRLEESRVAVTQGKPAPSIDKIINGVRSDLESLLEVSLRPVINASGVILHTNLGRAPLSEEAITAMDAVAKGYSNLEFDVDSGARGSRDVHIEKLLCLLTGSESAFVVNNNASAVLLVLTVLAKKKEVIVSRGQAVEIGGGFRIPDVMRQSGAKLVEVGTTNCTYINDYEQAISPRTAALLRVHSSNFRVEGFTTSVGIDELVALGKRHGIHVLDDLGSGCLLDTVSFGLAAEPTIQQSISVGVDLVCFSGDKLLGGPQAGIVLGSKSLIDKLKRHPLARAVRIDKIRLAGLVATLIHYLKGEAVEKVPIWRMISAPLNEVETRAKSWAKSIGDMAVVMEGQTMVGGGSLPGSTLPTRLVAIGSKVGNRSTVLSLSRKLRSNEPPVIGRIADDILLLDPRTVLPEEENILLKAVKTATSGLPEK